MKVTELFIQTRLCNSVKNAKQLITDGGARINNIVIDDPTMDVSVFEGNIVVGKLIGRLFHVHHSCLSIK